MHPSLDRPYSIEVKARERIRSLQSSPIYREAWLFSIGKTFLLTSILSLVPNFISIKDMDTNVYSMRVL